MADASQHPQTSFSTRPAPFRLLMAEESVRTGLVFASPHSGDFYPSDMGASADLGTLRQVEDAAVDRLISPAAQHGASVILALYGRAYVDLNRAGTDLDPALIEDCPPRHPSPKTLAGYGVLHRLSAERSPLYAKRLSLEQAEARLASVYRPYHTQLSDLMHSAHEAAGMAVLIDWHSMPQRATGPGGPDVVLGDRFGTSCDPDWTRAVRSMFETMGWRVGLNRPYAGGFATQTWGRPDEGFHALQIEINRRLYWDESGHKPGAGWKRCQTAVNRVGEQLCALARSVASRQG